MTTFWVATGDTDDTKLIDVSTTCDNDGTVQWVYAAAGRVMAAWFATARPRSRCCSGNGWGGTCRVPSAHWPGTALTPRKAARP